MFTCCQYYLTLLLLPKVGNAFIPLAAKAVSGNLNSRAKERFTDLRLQVPDEADKETSFSALKTGDEINFIKEALSQNVLFTNLPGPSLYALIDAFEKVKALRDEVIVYQGDLCYNDYVYLVADGECTVTVDGVMVPEPYGVIGPMSFFGDLGVLYNETRSATVTARSERVSLLRVPANTYLQILNKPSESLATMEEIDDVINQVSGTQALYRGDIIPRYKPERLWLWRQFKSTILPNSGQTALLNMLACCLFILFVEHETGQYTIPSELLANLPNVDMDTIQTVVVPNKELPLIQRLSLINEVWGYVRNLTTFVLTFFLNQAYHFWVDVYLLARQVQGRLNDLQLILATNIVSDRNEDGTHTEQVQNLLDDIGQYARLYHILMWASIASRFECLNTPEGLERLGSRGLMTTAQLKVLQNLDLPKDQLQNAPLEWIMIRFNQARASKLVDSDYATKAKFLSNLSRLRGSHADITDKLDGRMPLAYAHLVQILVDTFVLVAPFALYADLGVYSIFAVGLVTLSFTGFLNLSKIFLDPLNNEEFCDNSIFMDLGVLIRESNAGSTRWKNAGSELPF